MGICFGVAVMVSRHGFGVEGLLFWWSVMVSGGFWSPLFKIPLNPPFSKGEQTSAPNQRGKGMLSHTLTPNPSQSPFAKGRSLEVILALVRSLKYLIAKSAVTTPECLTKVL